MGNISNINEKAQIDKIQPKEFNNNDKNDKTEFSDSQKKEVKKAVKTLNSHLQKEDMQAVYEVHDKFKNDIIIKIINKNTKEVIMEVPPKKLLDMIANMCESMGIIFDKKA